VDSDRFIEVQNPQVIRLGGFFIIQ
jgi:hypothetical protein